MVLRPRRLSLAGLALATAAAGLTLLPASAEAAPAGHARTAAHTPPWPPPRPTSTSPECRHTSPS
ncbi:hypothetical protein ACFQ3Z_38650 [Streptomyces nogalater]